MKTMLLPNVVLTVAQSKATYRRTGEFRNNKPVFVIPARTILKKKSAFEEKKLCDGLTFSLGMACHARCSYCYVPCQLNRHPAIARILKETGLEFPAITVEKEDPFPVLRQELVNRCGLPRFADVNDRRVVFSSPLVDVAANPPTARQTVEACRLILENTPWQIRLLSKFGLLRMIAEELGEYRDRMIFGLSTGTFDDKLAATIEAGTSSPTARLRTLHWLQDNCYRTFAMVCPSLPQHDYNSFAAEAAERVRVERCKHVWAEVLNVRGLSLKNTCAALLKGGFEMEAAQVYGVSGTENKAAWEDYARATFLAHTKCVPPSKLRFLQYVQKGQAEWWNEQKNRGAILLGKKAKLDGLDTNPAVELTNGNDPTL